MMPALGAALALVLSAAAPAAGAAPSPAASRPAPPAAAEARQLAGRKAWDELYLRYSTARPADYKEPDRKAIASALLEASRGLGDDPALAVACAEKSAELAPTVDAWLAAGDLNLRLGQQAAAAAAYEKAVLAAPTDARALVARADLAMREGEPELAVSLYARVPSKAPEHQGVPDKLLKAKLAADEKAKAVAELARADRKIVAKTGRPAEDPGAVGNRAVCEESLRAVCILVRRCLPSDPGAGACDDEVESQCGRLAGLTNVTRKELDACVVGLGRAGCERFLGGARGVEELSPECRTVGRALDALRDAPGP